MSKFYSIVFILFIAIGVVGCGEDPSAYPVPTNPPCPDPYCPPERGNPTPYPNQ